MRHHRPPRRHWAVAASIVMLLAALFILAIPFIWWTVPYNGAIVVPVLGLSAGLIIIGISMKGRAR